MHLNFARLIGPSRARRFYALAGSLTAVAAVLPRAASAHFHISVAADGSQLAITPYGTDNAGLALHFDPTTHILQDSSGTVVSDLVLPNYSATGTGGAGPAEPFITAPTYYGEAFTLTTDYYTSSGAPGFATSDGSTYDPTKDPLAAGTSFPDIVYQLAGFTVVSGAASAADNVFAYDVPANPTGEPQHQDAYTAQSAAYPGLTQSLDYGYGNHIHGVELYSLQPGVYDLELIAHDATGQFADSDPAFLQITVPSAVPEPASLALLAPALLLLKRKRLA